LLRQTSDRNTCFFFVETGLHIVLVGLGGGGLPMFLRNNIPKVVEFDLFCIVT